MLIFALITLVTAAGCGGNGGAAPTPGPAKEQALGTRAVPGAAISVKRLQPAIPGETCLFRVTITGSEIAAVSARIGSTFEAGEVVVATITNQPGIFDLSIPIPAGMPADTRIWVSATLADGSVVQSGLADFAMK